MIAGTLNAVSFALRTRGKTVAALSTIMLSKRITRAMSFPTRNKPYEPVRVCPLAIFRMTVSLWLIERLTTLVWQGPADPEFFSPRS